MNKLVILSPSLKLSGGVASYVNSLKGKWGVDEIYFFRGGYHGSKLKKSVLFIIDILRFALFGLLLNSKSPVFINTSLNKKAFTRDLWYFKLCNFFNINYFIFIHGWDADFFHLIKNRLNTPCLNNAKNIFVLSYDFKTDLVSSGLDNNKIVVEITVVDSALIDFFRNFNSKVIKDSCNILYLARLEEEKGVFRVLESFKKLSNIRSDFKLRIIGSGSAEPVLKQWILDNNDLNVSFLGRLDGIIKFENLAWANYYILPTTHGEGLPISVLEAITAGCVVLVPPVGGLSYFFENKKMGFLLEHIDPDYISNLINEISFDKELLATISSDNLQRGRTLYDPYVIVARLKSYIYG